jgi:hypothetical protein
MSTHYKRDPKPQHWAHDSAEIAIVFGAVALFVSLLALTLIFAR